MEARDLTREYVSKTVFGGSRHSIAVNHADIVIDQASVTGITGASGSGKSTLVRCIAGLDAPTRGSVLYRGQDISLLEKTQRFAYRQKVQLVPQDPALTLSPRFTAARAVAEPLVIANSGNRIERRRQAIRWMEQMGLPADTADRPTLEFSGGERCRIAIARGLILNPEVVIFDESFSALDGPVRTRILELLIGLQSSHRLTYIFVSHDFGLLARWCHDVFVMDHGRIVEAGSVDRLLMTPVHPCTRQLVKAIPRAPADWLI